MSHLTLGGALGVPEVVTSSGKNFSTTVYTGTGAYPNSVDTGINMQGEPLAAVDAKLVESFSAVSYRGDAVIGRELDTGINLTEDGGLAWVKNLELNTSDHILTDTVRGPNRNVYSDQAYAESVATTRIQGFNENGITLGANSWVNDITDSFMCWSFKRTAKFFDVVTWEGTGATRDIPHNLGIAPGMIMVKQYSSGADWAVWHRSPTAQNGDNVFRMNTSSNWETRGEAIFGDTGSPVDMNATTFSVGTVAFTNIVGHSYIAYVFAHDPASDSMIKCDKYTGDGVINAGGQEINLGWAPQYLMIKNITSGVQWVTLDTTMGIFDEASDGFVSPSTTGWIDFSDMRITPTATGFKLDTTNSAFNTSGDEYAYLAIRAPQFTSDSKCMTMVKDRHNTNPTSIWNNIEGGTASTRPTDTSSRINRSTDLGKFTHNGFIARGIQTTISNTNTRDYVSWNFKAAPKFFDVVHYTGDGIAGKEIAHNLGVAPGMIWVKKLSAISDWMVYHRSTLATHYLNLNDTGFAADLNTIWNDVEPTDSVFTLGNSDPTNENGGEFVAYLFAHDTEDDSMIKCGDYIGNGVADGPEIDLGWQPQFVLIKAAKVYGSGSWMIYDTARNMTFDNQTSVQLEMTTAEGSPQATGLWCRPTATGFKLLTGNGMVNAVGSGDRQYIYMAIRIDQTVPTAGTDVLSFDTHTTYTAGNPNYRATFAPDAEMHRVVTSAASTFLTSRLTGDNYMYTNSTAAQVSNQYVTWDHYNGIRSDVGGSNVNEVGYMFKRAPGFMDVVTYTGTGAVRTVPHNLGAVPQLIIIKHRTTVRNWRVYSETVGNGSMLTLNSGGGSEVTALWNNTSPTGTEFSLNADLDINGVTVAYVAYLFGTVENVSKVGTYTGDGAANQVIDCGFSTGARFVLIKRHDGSSDWGLFDTHRGIIAGNDPYMTLHESTTQVTTWDGIDPDASGFSVTNNAGPLVNESGQNYIYLAIS